MPINVTNRATFNPIGITHGRQIGASNTGHLAAPGWPGSFTGGTFTTTPTVTSGSTVEYADFIDGCNIGSTGTPISSPVTFRGCRFQGSGSASADGPDQNDYGAHCYLFANALVTFEYCTFQPAVANYPTRLTGEEIEADRSTWVQYGDGYQYALIGDGGFNTFVAGGLLVDYCDFWGFGNALQLGGSTVANPHIVKRSWFHHSSDPFVKNSNGSTQWHNDGWLCNGNGGSYRGAQALMNRMEIGGNTNLIAWQQDVGSPAVYSDCTVAGNVFGGDQNTVAMGEGRTTAGQRMIFRDNDFTTRIGRSVGTGRPLYSGLWDVSDDGAEGAGGSFWGRNLYVVGAGEAQANYPGANWGNPDKDGTYWHPGDTDTFIRTGTAHASDYAAA